MNDHFITTPFCYPRYDLPTNLETVNSQLENMGINRLRARTNNGFFLKIQASLLAVWQTQCADAC